MFFLNVVMSFDLFCPSIHSNCKDIIYCFCALIYNNFVEIFFFLPKLFTDFSYILNA